MRILLKRINLHSPLLLFALAAGLWLFYCLTSPAYEFVGPYHDLVMDSGNLAQNKMIFNPPWLAPVLAPFIILPGRSGFILYLAAGLASLAASSRIFGGKTSLMLLSAQMWWIAWWAQIDWLVVLGITLAWLALEKRSLALLALGIFLASVKPQISIFPILAIWWWSGSLRWKALGIMLAVFIASLFIWELWPVYTVAKIILKVDQNAYAFQNISIGLPALPLLLPALLLPMERKKRLIALVATGMLISPYMPYYSSILLLCLPIPIWAYVFAFIGYFSPLIGMQLAWNSIILLPLAVLAWLYWPNIVSGCKRLIKLRLHS